MHNVLMRRCVMMKMMSMLSHKERTLEIIAFEKHRAVSQSIKGQLKP